ncbi:intermediate filament protein-like protein [Westerdykella ornata]|uniref:Intermediate filament protein-like protein n=1 Tax=Westerdykella ornata TaxID=318751 RepID=A0A6A6J5K0_WESOR|nr:intermediate filament protein-like protein [Westerdykella ornata]KAF2271413.1 intermediate filament protein-like protein [Westerdykella ornata]
MALKRRDVVLSAVAVFIAWGYLTHWQPALRFLPHAFIAGIVATLALQTWLMCTTAWPKPQPADAEVDYGPKRLAFLAPDKWKVEREALTKRSMYMMEPVYPASFVISDSIDVLIGLILRDFVKGWYGNISKSPTFVNEVDRAVRTALGDIRDRLLAVDMVATAVSKVIPLITDHLRASYEAERLVRGHKLSRNVTESEELDLAIAAKYKGGHLHPAASLAYSNTKTIQQQHLRSIVARLLPKIMPRNMTTSSAVNVLIKEILACAVLFPVVQMLADPDTWNQLMEGYGRKVLEERKSVRKLRAALDEHAPPSPKRPKEVQFPKLSPHDNERRFERFIRAIRQTNTLADARRFRSEVAIQLRKDSAVEGQDPIYIRRLETAKKILDQKVDSLSAGGSVRAKVAAQERPKHRRTRSKFENASLREVLYDASGLSCFMEYMDRLNLMRLVQFWIVVDGFRNPLEQDTDEPLEHMGSLPAWTDSDRADLAQINEAYLSRSEFKTLQEAREAVKEFLKAGRAATPQQYFKARRALLRAQTAVYEELQEPHFRRFKKSDLYYKWLAMDEAANGDAVPDSTKAGAQGSDTGSAPPVGRVPRTQSGLRNNLQPPDLRRAIASSSDLKSQSRVNELNAPARRSLDDNAPSRPPLFDDEYDTDPLANSVTSLASEPERSGANNPKVVESMQAALTDIMGAEPEGSLFYEPSLNSPLDSDSMRASIDLPRTSSPNPAKMQKKDKDVPSIASLGLVGEPKTRGVFDDDLFGEEEKFLEDELEESSPETNPEEDEIHEAAPGDLGLAEAIDRLTAEIERLVRQESIVDSLTSKAELTNNAAELRILRKSKASLQREIHRKELQRQQYIVQESDNSLYGRATVFIQSIMVGTEADGREYAMYVIEVRRRAGDHMPAAAWVITRRYSEFHELHKRLRAKFPQVRNLELPRRQMVLKLQKDFLQKRRVGLEKYLRELLLIPAVCRSRELRAFLSQQAISPIDTGKPETADRDFVTRIYNSVADGMEEFLGNIPVLDQLSVAGQNLISAATNQLAANGAAGSAAGGASALIGVPEPASDADAEAELLAFENKELEPFVKPICDLFLETFELNRENNWLRGRAVVVVLHQLLGGTIERKVRDSFASLTSEDSIARYIDTLKDSVWPNGKLKQSVERTQADRDKSRKEAGMVLATLIPELAASVVGRSNAQAASRRLLATFNNSRLNTHLVFTLLDEVIQILFPDVMVR